MMSLTGRHDGHNNSQRRLHKRIAALGRGDFRFGPLNVFLLVLLFVTGLAVHLNVHTVSTEAVLLALGSAIALAVILSLFPFWQTVVILATGDALSIFMVMRRHRESSTVMAEMAMFVAPSVQIA